MRSCNPFAAVLFALGVCAGIAADVPRAHAQREPVIVVPGRAGVPVMLWGQDVSGAVIEGEFGLDRPGGFDGGLNVIRPIGPYYQGIPPQPPADGYYPATGMRPKVGRQEVLPPANAAPPPPAASFNRSWTSESPRLPANVDPPVNPPPVILAPQIYQQPPGPPGPNPGPMPGPPLRGR